MAEITDEVLATRAQQGGTEWFALLVERYEAKLSRYASRFLLGKEDTQDLVQEVFLKAYTNLQSFDPKRKFSPWIYRIAHNEFISSLKKREREPLSLIDPDTILPHTVEEEEVNLEELRPKLDKWLDEVGEKYREILILHYLEDLDYKEISEILRIPVSTVGVRLKRGREALRKVKDRHEHGTR